MDVKRLLIVRHGNTFETGEPPRRIGARTDLPLTAEGERQARRLGEFFAGRRFAVDKILCGPLRRSRRTASLLRRELGGCRIAVVSWLNEIDHGPDEGRDERDVLARVGADALTQWDRTALAPPGWLVDPAAVMATWRREVAALGAGTTLLVTSNGTARLGLMALIAEGLPASLKLRTGAAGEIVVADGVARLADWDIRPPSM